MAPEDNPEPWREGIIAEVQSIREQLFADCDYDLDELCDQLRRDERARGRSPVSYPKLAC